MMPRQSKVRQNLSVMCTRERKPRGRAGGEPGEKIELHFFPLNPVACVMSRQLGSHLTWGVKCP